MQHDAVLATEAELSALRKTYRFHRDALLIAEDAACDAPGGELAGRTGLVALVGSQCLASLTQPERIHLLAALRDQHCRFIRLVVHAPDEPPLPRTDLLALGFTGPHPGPASAAEYAYDADDYNAPRDWNTPAHWAHPERFDKERW